MSIVLLVITDGRFECLQRTIESARRNVRGPITRLVIYDDSGDDHYRFRIAKRFPHFEHCNGGDRRGFAGAIRACWSYLLLGSERFVFHLEGDFTFNLSVDLGHLAKVLDAQPQLVQLALRRQPWSDAERAAGGFIEQHPDDYADCSDAEGHNWLEQRRFFTTNPSLYRRSLMAEHEWPLCEHSEGVFTHQLLADPSIRFGYWGARDSGEWVEHIGRERVGSGY